jgi:mannose-6-phosphate isomerase-like protein (cupin superfamily)
MPTLIDTPTVVAAASNKPKRIEEFVGRVTNGTATVSVARMTSPSGWVEPGQSPEFDEYTIVLRGMVRVESRGQTFEVHAGQTIVTRKGEWIRSARRVRTARSTSPSACRLSRQKRYIAIPSSVSAHSASGCDCVVVLVGSRIVSPL